MLYDINLQNIDLRNTNELLFEDLSVMIESDKTTFLMGRSGAGKTTILELITGLIQPDRGYVFWGDVDINKISKEKLNILRQDIGFQFQNNALICNLSVSNNIALPLRYHTLSSIKSVDGVVNYQLFRWGISDIAKRLPETLSVSQAKLTAIARALIMKPKLLLLDEPLSGLDQITLTNVKERLINVCSKGDTTILIVSNNYDFIKRVNGQVIILENGKVKKYNTIDDMIDNSDGSAIIKNL